MSDHRDSCCNQRKCNYLDHYLISDFDFGFSLHHYPIEKAIRAIIASSVWFKLKYLSLDVLGFFSRRSLRSDRKVIRDSPVLIKEKQSLKSLPDQSPSIGKMFGFSFRHSDTWILNYICTCSNRSLCIDYIFWHWHLLSRKAATREANHLNHQLISEIESGWTISVSIRTIMKMRGNFDRMREPKVGKRCAWICPGLSDVLL